MVFEQERERELLPANEILGTNFREFGKFIFISRE
jgi:hypothetical protein